MNSTPAEAATLVNTGQGSGRADVSESFSVAGFSVVGFTDEETGDEETGDEDFESTESATRVSDVQPQIAIRISDPGNINLVAWWGFKFRVPPCRDQEKKALTQRIEGSGVHREN